MINYADSKIWSKLKAQCTDLGELAGIGKLCDDALELVKTTRDTFPTYTLHDEKHICNVISMMELILGDKGIDCLSIGECAMLILAACYHDVGMCYTEENRKKKLKSNRFQEYLDKNPKIFLQVEEKREIGEEIPEEIQINYFRNIHHLRVGEMLLAETWSLKSVRRDMLIEICRSHGESLESVIGRLQYDTFQETDYVLCAILLRLADVLDFDSSRAPDILYRFQKINTAKDKRADIEWRKHHMSKGFKIIEGKERILAYGAVCQSMQDEYEIRKYLDYIDEELESCLQILERYGQAKWKELKIPKKVDRNIERQGYQTGEYRLTLDAENVLQMLVGNDLYGTDTTFIRELLQNAMDAVRARRMTDYRWNQQEEHQIILSDWMDKDGYYWFRIDDLGIGMTEQIIMDYFLKVGKSYYKSDEFRKLSYDNKRYYNFNPISQFGIGILSCFLKGDQMEVSTRHYIDRKGIRFTMNGIRGYYSIAKEEKGDTGEIMPCMDEENDERYCQNVGTSIAVRMQEYLSESMLHSLQKYLCFPDIKVKYQNGVHNFSIPTEGELMEFVKKNREIKIPFPEDLMKKIKDRMPEIQWEVEPYLYLQCTPLDELAETPFITGADFEIMIAGVHNGDEINFIDNYKIIKTLEMDLVIRKHDIDISIYYNISVYKKRDYQEVSLEEILDKYSKMHEESEGENTNVQKIEELIKKNKIKISSQILFSVDTRMQSFMERFIIPRCISGESCISNHKTEKVYNGIRVETATANYETAENKNFRYTVLLLSQEFQPKLGISREKVQYFPIKATAYIELLGQKIGNSGFACDYSSYYGTLELGQYNELLCDSKFCEYAEQVLEIEYKKSIKDIKEKIKESDVKEKIFIPGFDAFFGGMFYEPRFYFLDILLRAFVQKEFCISWEYNENNYREYYITGMRKEPISSSEQKLLPLTFVKSRNNNTEILTEADIFCRCTLNADHPFSVWMIEQAEYLEKQHKSLWKKLIKCICEYEAESMISDVNMILKEIEKRDYRSIPDNVWLKNSDFLRMR